MYKFFNVEAWDYMDPHPVIEVECLDEDKAKDWEKHMNENYSGGTTKILSVMTEQQARDYSAGLIRRERKYPQPDSKEFIEHVLTLIHKSYK